MSHDMSMSLPEGTAKDGRMFSQESALARGSSAWGGATARPRNG